MSPPLTLKDVCTISNAQEGIQPFCIQRAANGSISVQSKACLQIFKPKFKFISPLNMFYLKPYTIKCPQSIPTNDIDTNEVEIYNSAGLLEKHDLLLDTRYMPKLSSTTASQLIQSRACSWSPMNSNGDCFIAYLSNYGGLEIYFENKKLLDIGQYWLREVTKDMSFPLKTLNDLETPVEDILLTSICWDQRIQNDQVYRLICMTKSSKCLVFRFQLTTQLQEDSNLELQYVSEVPQKHVLCLKWMSLCKNIKNEQELFVAGSLDGKISIYGIDSNGKVSVKTTVWDEEDHLATVGIEVSKTSSGQFIIVAVKGGHFLSFLCDKELNLIGQDCNMVSSYPITGLLRLNEVEFVLTTLNSKVLKVTILLEEKQNIKLQVENVQTDFNVNGCSLYGIAASINNAYITIISFVTQSFDHLTLRQPVNLIVCRPSHVDAFQELVNVPSKSLLGVQDIIEVVRYMGAKDIKILNKFEETLSISENVGFTKDFEYRLKVATVLAGARYTYYRLRSQEETEKTCDRLKALLQVTEVLRAYEILKELKHPTSEFQLLSGKCLRLYILEYIKQIPTLEEFKTIHDALVVPFTELIMATIKFNDVPNEICAYCDLEVRQNSLTCEENHTPIRCCISKVQVTLCTNGICPQCDRCCWSNLEDLKSIVQEKYQYLLCPLCDIPFVPS